MKNAASTNAQHQASHPVGTLKTWSKPVLDILELQSAERGFHHHPGDGAFSARSG